MSKVVGVVFVGKCARPRKRIKICLHSVLRFVRFGTIILVVLYVRAASSPAQLLVLGVQLAIKQRPHAHVVQALRFEKIAYRKTVFDVWLGVFYLKIEPLRVSIRVQIVSHVQIVFIVGA